ncbi:MAG TPA: hypothetical protein VHO23_00110 [Candidatus Paceibacterota bacterium]|nr:hypothetical protein [Candidatus Paceibacterota bacterium]
MDDPSPETAIPKARPRWDRDGGMYHLQRIDGKDCLVRWKPSVRHICGPLMGTTKTRGDSSRFARYPHLDERLALYQEGLEVVEVFRDPDDVFALALYRRQLTNPDEPEDRGYAIDSAFFALAKELLGRGGIRAWRQLARRMPRHAPIRGWCLAHAWSLRPQRATELLSDAA